jgi:hypothetical protein
MISGTFEHLASLNSEKKLCGSIYLLSFGGITVGHIRNSKTWISINHIFANLMQLEGISTADLDTKTYLMSMKISSFTAVYFRLCNIPQLTYSLIYYSY